MSNIIVVPGQIAHFRFKMKSLEPPKTAIIACVASDKLAVFESQSINGLATIRQIGFGHEYFYCKVGSVMRVVWRTILEDLWVYQGGQLVPLVHYRPFL